MARPFPNTFEKDSPISPQSAGGNISYQTNVNRQKTRKWAEAKPANYGGDDWGDDDEYDLPPPPISKPTGLRQQGQALPTPAQGDASMVDNERKYGDLPPLPPANNPRGRTNSFDADDEKRNFSSSTARQPSPSVVAPTSGGPATRFSQITGVPSTHNASGHPPLQISTQATPAPTGLRKATQIISPISGSPHPEILQPGRVNTGESSVSSPSIASLTAEPRTASGDYNARRDYSPSAVPLPLSTRASPPPQSTTDSPTARFPARKSSMSQVTGPPPLSEIMQSTSEQPTPKPWVAARSASPGGAERAPVAPAGKSLPFIRPADIYRRVEEERERERQSMDSSRPSMDSIVGTKTSERSESPANLPQGRDISSADNSSVGSWRGRTGYEGEDATDSGRRLMPILEPVRERKSEYGFDGFNVNTPPVESDRASRTEPDRTFTANRGDLEVENIRAKSTSPKLPDLNRISGFGMDLFASSFQDPKPASEDTNVPPVPSGGQISSTADTPKLQSQPTFGFKSAVNQAFDRNDDSSVPDTPTSSVVKRTDSESTGTDGISPIMSRVSSAAIRDNRDNRDVPNASILEVVEEPVSPEETHPQIQREGGSVQLDSIPNFKPGHRRDISIPSPDNSPARTPDLAEAPINTGGHRAIVSGTTREVSTLTDEEPLQPPRPLAEHSQSFRPNLPGGWTSFGATPDSEAPPSADKTQTPMSDISSVRDQPNRSEHDITPTATRQTSPRSAFGATVASAAVAGALEKSGQVSTVTSPEIDKSSSLQRNDALPTPDPAMAPSGNLYSATALDPRLGPKPVNERAPQDIQSRPDMAVRNASDDSSARPPPPPKDTPVLDPKSTAFGYFPISSMPSEMPVETDNKTNQPEEVLTPYHEENERLEDEIVKSLTPKPTPDQDEEDQLEDQLDEGQVGAQGRESTYLPREYDNYWASTAEDDDVPEVPALITSQKDFEGYQPPITVSIPKSTSEPESHSPVIAPLSPRRPDAESARPPITTRFSWEMDSENVSVAPEMNESPNTEALGTLPLAQNALPLAERTVPTSELNQSVEGVSTPIAAPFESDKEVYHYGDDLEVNPSEDHHVGRDAAIVGGAAVAVGTAAALTEQAPNKSERRQSLAEEKDPLVSSYPVSPTPPEDQHPANAHQPYFSSPIDRPSEPPAPSTMSPIAPPANKQFPPTSGKLLSFKEIAAMSSPYQRIHHYDQTRQRFAAIDSGLNDWILRLQSQFPEHVNATASFNGSGFTASNGARSKFVKAPGGGALPLQQPYYQQYLNASSPTTPSTPVRPGTSGPSLGGSSSQAGFSPAGGKLTSHQVQAKGKELLHTAGIFGGKAGKAGKGLLAKGKSKLRGAGGGDKTISPTKAKTERRSSWSLPPALSRSSGPSDSSKRFSFSKETSSMPHPPPSRDATAEPDSSPVQLPPVPAGDFLGMMSGALSASDHLHDAQSPSSPSPTDIPSAAATDAERHDTLGVPAPIGKNQPSWDPFNATPIAEEEGFQFDERSKQQRDQWQQQQQQQQRQRRVSTDSAANRHGSLVSSLLQRDRSNSADASFFNAREQADDNDWVMVTPDQVGKVSEKENEKENGNEDAEEETERNITEPELEKGDEPDVVADSRPVVQAEEARSDRPLERELVPDPHPVPEETRLEEPLEQEVVAESRPEESMEQEAITESRPVEEESLEHEVIAESRPPPEEFLEQEIVAEPQPALEGSLEQKAVAEPQPAPEEPLEHEVVTEPPPLVEETRADEPLEREVISEHPITSEEPRVERLQEPEAKVDHRDVRLHEAQIQPQPKVEQVPEPEDEVSEEEEEERPLEPPAPSILNRPRGASYGFESAPSIIPPNSPPPRSQPSPPSPPTPVRTPVLPPLSIPQPQQEQTSTSSFLPPIRRTSTFGLGFGPRQSKPRFPLDEEEAIPRPTQLQEDRNQNRARAFAGAGAGGAALGAVSAYSSPPNQDIRHHPLPSGIPVGPPGEATPKQVAQYLHEAAYRQQSPAPQQQARQRHGVTLTDAPIKPRDPVFQHQPPPIQTNGMRLPQPQFNPPRGADMQFHPEKSQVEWRQVRPKATTTQAPVSPGYWKEQDIPPPRNSWEPQRPRGYSGSSQNYGQRPEGQPKSFEQPPSSAQRYPELFRADQAGEVPKDMDNLPANYYQAPISRGAAFLPRQQTNEYQLPGVGPPTDEPRSAGSRRSTRFYKEIGGRLSRASSRERSNSISQDDAMYPMRKSESRGNEYAESSVASEDGAGTEQKKRRSSFFSSLNRASTNGLGPPQSRESVIAHNPGSRIDLLSSGEASPVAQQEKKRSFFGSRPSTDSKLKPNNKLIRASTGAMVDDTGKKKRFSALSGLFGKPSNSTREAGHLQAARQLTYNERQPIESPQFPPTKSATMQFPAHIETPPRAPSQPRSTILSKSQTTLQTPDTKSRRSSAAGLLSGIIGRKSNQQDRSSDDSRSQGSNSQSNLGPQFLPPAQTYTELQEQQQRMAPPPKKPRQASVPPPSMPPPERGRQVVREPQYDSVPIPGGYSLVRGQGATPVQTEYDPRGLNRMQVDPRVVQSSPKVFQKPISTPPQGPQQQFPNSQQYRGAQVQRPEYPPAKRLQQRPNVKTLNSYDSYSSGSPQQRLNREDELARSPPQSPEGQQRPYQLSLPDEDNVRPEPPSKDIPVFPSPPSTIHTSPGRHIPQHDSIQRLQQPQLRHPQSPAGYPLPEDSALSPINPVAKGLPAPPPPQWPLNRTQNPNAMQDPSGHRHSSSLTSSLSATGIDRSNTRRTAVSALSFTSGAGEERRDSNTPDLQGGQSLAHQEQYRDAKGDLRVKVLRSTPTPPSPLGTPPPAQRQNSLPAPTARLPEATGQGDIRSTQIGIREHSPDLYNASPRLPRQSSFPRTNTIPTSTSSTPPPSQPAVSSNLNPQSTRAANGRYTPPNPAGAMSAAASATTASAAAAAAARVKENQSLSRAQEEKIPLDEEQNDNENEVAAMTATSYPGQEWNPYVEGAWDEGFD